MWEHSATQANMAALEARGVLRIDPVEGDMACGEWGLGRLAEADAICTAVEDFLAASGRLAGRRALVTSGPTFESLDPVRYLANRSSGKQGHAIARAFSRLGADTVLVSGPTAQPDPAGVETVHVETAMQMLEACEKALPVDAFVAAAAVTDWRIAEPAADKIKKGQAPTLELVENPDILARIAGAGNRRPGLVIGFAAETSSLLANAAEKRRAKGCDWILANDVSAGTGVFGGDSNTVHLVTGEGVEEWPRMSKDAVAERLTSRIADALDAAS
jgi:phosphopantothenoylcysteine decarboxylase/phosphopantothenate--cysteine ligase